jgi:hypothetical protein
MEVDLERLRATLQGHSDAFELFFAHVHLHGGPAPVRRFLPELIDLVWNGKIDPGKVFDLTLLRSGGGGLPRDGRAACDQDAAAPVGRSASIPIARLSLD